MRIHTPRITGSLEVSSSVLSIDNAGTISGSSISTGSFGHVNTFELGSDVSTLISGSITESSASFSTRVALLEGSGSITESSASFSTRVTTNEASGALLDGDGSPTFSDLTVTGRITAEQFQTKFVSASIALITGSNIFGDEASDTHQFTGSILSSGSLTLSTIGASDITTAGDIESTKELGKISGSATSTGSFGSIVTGGTGVSSFTGNVGIGHAAPSAPLDVVVSAGSNALVAEMKDSGGNGLNFSINNSSPYTQIIGVGGGESLALATGGITTQRLHINTSGLVGIGTASPAAHLEVVGGTDYSQIQLTDTDTDNTVQRTGILSQHYDSDEQAIRTIGMYNSDTTSNVQIGGGSGDHNSATLLQFFTSANTTTTAGTLRMIVSSSGYVGIGESSPDGRLEISDGLGQVSTGVYISNTRNANNNNFIRFRKSRQASGTDETIITSGDYLGQIEFQGADATNGYETGAVIYAISSGSIASNQIPTMLQFHTENTSGTLAERMRITPDGVLSSAYGMKYTKANGDSPAGDFQDIGLKHAVFLQTVTDSHRGDGYVNFSCSIYRDNVIAIIPGFFGAAATNNHRAGFESNYISGAFLFAGGTLRATIGSSVATGDKIYLTVMYHGDTG